MIQAKLYGFLEPTPDTVFLAELYAGANPDPCPHERVSLQQGCL